MFKINDYIVYRREVVKVLDIKHNQQNRIDYYVLGSLLDSSLKIEIPVEDKSGNLRSLITKNQVNDIINNIPNIKVIDCDDIRLLEVEYKQLLYSGNHEDLIRIIKTTYLRNKERLDNRKKLSDRDSNYFNLAEKCLYQEISMVLGLSYDDAKAYVINQVQKINEY